MEDIIRMINDMGIPVHRVLRMRTPLCWPTPIPTRQPLKKPLPRWPRWGTDIGRTTDPVRMYMREMGTVELLTREGEIEIAKRIEEVSW